MITPLSVPQTCLSLSPTQSSPTTVSACPQPGGAATRLMTSAAGPVPHPAVRRVVLRALENSADRGRNAFPVDIRDEKTCVRADAVLWTQFGHPAKALRSSCRKLAHALSPALTSPPVLSLALSSAALGPLEMRWKRSSGDSPRLVVSDDGLVRRRTLPPPPPPPLPQLPPLPTLAASVRPARGLLEAGMLPGRACVTDLHLSKNFRFQSPLFPNRRRLSASRLATPPASPSARPPSARPGGSTAGGCGSTPSPARCTSASPTHARPRRRAWQSC